MIDPENIDWEKGDGLVPAIVQCADTGEVRMLGYMNRDALERTLHTNRVTFFSRSRNELWEKGETSGNGLDLVNVAMDCDRDCLLVSARPNGPTCHEGSDSCFGKSSSMPTSILHELAKTVAERAASKDGNKSYTARLINEGLPRIAQKVGEEGVEVALAATTAGKDEIESEAADLIYHLTVLFQSSGASWEGVLGELSRRHRAASNNTASS